MSLLTQGKRRKLLEIRRSNILIESHRTKQESRGGRVLFAIQSWELSHLFESRVGQAVLTNHKTKRFIRSAGTRLKFEGLSDATRALGAVRVSRVRLNIHPDFGSALCNSAAEQSAALTCIAWLELCSATLSWAECVQFELRRKTNYVWATFPPEIYRRTWTKKKTSGVTGIRGRKMSVVRMSRFAG